MYFGVRVVSYFGNLRPNNKFRQIQIKCLVDNKKIISRCSHKFCQMRINGFKNCVLKTHILKTLIFKNTLFKTAYPNKP